MNQAKQREVLQRGRSRAAEIYCQGQEEEKRRRGGAAGTCRQEGRPSGAERAVGERGREWASLPAFSHAPSAIVGPEDAAREGWWMRRKGWGKEERRDESLPVQRCDYLKGGTAAGAGEKKQKNSLKATRRLVSAANLFDGAFWREKRTYNRHVTWSAVHTRPPGGEGGWLGLGCSQLELLSFSWTRASEPAAAASPLLFGNTVANIRTELCWTPLEDTTARIVSRPDTGGGSQQQYESLSLGQQFSSRVCKLWHFHAFSFFFFSCAHAKLFGM